MKELLGHLYLQENQRPEVRLHKPILARQYIMSVLQLLTDMLDADLCFGVHECENTKCKALFAMYMHQEASMCVAAVASLLALVFRMQPCSSERCIN